MSNEKLLYTVTEVSEILHTNKGYVYELIKAGLLPVLKLGSFKIRREALIKFINDSEGKDLTNPGQICTIKFKNKTDNS